MDGNGMGGGGGVGRLAGAIHAYREQRHAQPCGDCPERTAEDEHQDPSAMRAATGPAGGGLYPHPLCSKTG